jgi:uncharacterized protein (TIGR00369 family)
VSDTNSEEPIIYRADMGLQNALGYVTYVYSDRTEIELDVGEIHLNRAGFLHGGIICTLLDSACGYAASRHLSETAIQRVVTLTLTTNYLKPGGPGPVRAICRVTGGGAKTIFTEGELIDGKDNQLATCSAIMRKIHGEVS